jgi:hypothetical protein
MTAAEFFVWLFNLVDMIMSLSFRIFGLDITLWGLFIGSVIVVILRKIFFG